MSPHEVIGLRVSIILGAIVTAYESGGYTLKELGNYLGLRYSMVSGVKKDHKSKT